MRWTRRANRKAAMMRAQAVLCESNVSVVPTSGRHGNEIESRTHGVHTQRATNPNSLATLALRMLERSPCRVLGETAGRLGMRRTTRRRTPGCATPATTIGYVSPLRNGLSERSSVRDLQRRRIIGDLLHEPTASRGPMHSVHIETLPNLRTIKFPQGRDHHAYCA
jgi:hypothetical protein